MNQSVTQHLDKSSFGVLRAQEVWDGDPFLLRMVRLPLALAVQCWAPAFKKDKVQKAKDWGGVCSW